MEVDWLVARTRLYQLRKEHPQWSQKQLAEEVGYSSSWTKKWLHRFAQAEEVTPELFHSRSRRPSTSQKRVMEAVVRRILEIRDQPPRPLNRIPGPVTILYYLHQAVDLKQQQLYLPTSSRTVWQILDQHQRIWRPSRAQGEREERPEPLTHWQMDFKSISTVPPDPDGKQQHVVETLNVVDKGTSILLTAIPRDDFNAETVFDPLVYTMQVRGLPEAITFDRDPRFIGSWSADDFPSPLMRFLYALDIRPDICPPHRPDKNSFVERYHRSYQGECLAVHRPSTLEETVSCTFNYHCFYNKERPNQAFSCGNQPPFKAFPQLPQRPALPTSVDPDQWVHKIDGQPYRRRIKANGSIQIGRYYYYISQKLQGQRIILQVDAAEQVLLALLDGVCIKKVKLKGLVGSPLLFEDYLTYIKQEAVSDYRYYLHQHRRH